MCRYEAAGMSAHGPSRHVVLKRLSVAFGAKLTWPELLPLDWVANDPEPTFACRRPRAYLTRLAPFHTCEKGVP